MFLLHDLLDACTKRFKRSKIDYDTHQTVWEGLKLWIAFQYDNGRGCELPHFGRIVLQSAPGTGPGDVGAKTPTFVICSRAASRHGIKHAKVPTVATQRMHVAKINYVAISEAVSVTRDVATEAVKQLLWCLLEAMSNRKDVIIDIGIGDLKCKKCHVHIDFEREPGTGFKKAPMAPLTAQSQRTMSRASMRSSGSTLRPPSAAGTELDWDSLSVSGQGSQARQSPRGSARILSVDTIPEGAEGEFEGEGDYAPLEGLDVMTESQRESVESLPPISKAVSDGGGSQYEDMGAITAEQRSDLNEQYLENHKSNKDWLSAYGATSKTQKDRYLDQVFDRYEAALKHSQEALHEEAMELHRATLAEDRLRATVRHRKRAARHAVASDLKVQMQEREKRNQRILLEQMIVSAPEFPHTERGLLSAEQRKKMRLREYLDRQRVENANRRNLETRYELVQEQVKLRDDAHRYQDEIVEDASRRRAAGRDLCDVWDRQRALKTLELTVNAMM